METTAGILEQAPTIEALYRHDGDRLWRAVYAFCGDADMASDAVAEAFAQLLGRGDQVRDPAAWTWRAAFRIARGALKARRAGEQLPSIPLEHVDRYADPDIVAALRQLPDNQRAALILFYYADLPVRDVAARLGSNSLAVRATLSRGRRNLRRYLGHE